jgi:DNA primase
MSSAHPAISNPIELISELVEEYPLGDFIEKHGRGALNADGSACFVCPRCQRGQLKIAGNTWSCSLCLTDGNVVDFAADLEGDVSVRTVAGFLASSKGLDAPAWTSASHPSLVSVLRDAQKIFTEHFPLAQNALLDRGADLEISRAHGLGWCPSDLAEKLDRVSIDMRTPAKEVGLLSHLGSSLLAGRVTIPIHDHEGQLVGFSGWKKNAEPKYRDLKRSPIFHMESVLYNYRKAQGACRSKGFTIVVEGFFDVTSMESIGLRNVVAICKNRVSPNQAALLASLAPVAILMLDGDRGGEQGSAASAELLAKAGVRTKNAQLTDKEDPDMLVRTNRSEFILTLLSTFGH